jgi:hypothetical protein
MPSAMMRDAFVSYATRDSRDTLLICAGLRALGIRLWLDSEELVASRATWRQAVHTGIASSRTMLIALSPNWAQSPACRYELAIAVERRTPLLAMALPEEPEGRPSRNGLLPDGVELIDGGGAVTRTIALVASRLAQRR